jgi:hypothetical protein
MNSSDEAIFLDMPPASVALFFACTIKMLNGNFPTTVGAFFPLYALRMLKSCSTLVWPV